MVATTRRRATARRRAAVAGLALGGLSFACTLGGALGGSSIRLTECPTDGPEATFRWVNGGEYLYVEGVGSCITIGDIFNNMDYPPLVPMLYNGTEADEPTGIWLLTKNLFMESGTSLLLHDDLGCDELRLVSSSKNAIQLRSHGAYISLLRTKVFSWSRGDGVYDKGAYNGKNPRSFLSVISEMTHRSDKCKGAADDDAGEGRMDIINSEVGYLGYQGPEAYGLSYKVRGYCKDESNPEVFERVNVRGDIRFSDIHHNWFGLYTYGHQDGNWEYNLMHDSGYYGFDPHDDSDNLRIHNNIVYDNGNHGIIASKRCNDVSIQNNVVRGSKLHGIMLHRSSDNGIIRNNTVIGSGDACIALFESFDIEVSHNTCEGNGVGIRLSMGASYNKIFDNRIVNTQGKAYWLYQGSDALIASKTFNGRCTGNIFENNLVDSAEFGVKMLESRDNVVIGNTFVDTQGNDWSSSDGLLWSGNDIHPGFEMEIDTTCLNAGSDFVQIEAAGGFIKKC